MRSCMLLLTVDRSEYKVQQERIIADDLRSSLEIERSRNVELTSQLSRERSSQGESRRYVNAVIPNKAANKRTCTIPTDGVCGLVVSGDVRAEVVGYQSQLAKLQDALEREQDRLLSAS